MAKIVPKGYADIGAYNEMDDYTQIMDFLRGVSQDVRAVKREKESNNIQSLSLINNLIDNAKDSNDIQQIRNIYKQNFDDKFQSSNPNYNTLVDISNMALENRSTQISDFEGSSQEFADMLYSTDNEFNTNILNLGAEEVEGLFSKMNKDELGGWMDTALDTRDNIVRYKASIKDLYGNKNPNFKIMVNGQKRSIVEVMQNLDRFDQTIDVLVNKALDDGILSPQEAQAIATIRPSQGKGSAQIKQLFENKRTLGRQMIQDGDKLINSRTMSNLQKVIKEGGDIRAQIPSIFQDEFEADIAEKHIPMLEQVIDQNGNIIPAITGIMSREEKVETLMKHLEAGSIDQTTLLAFAKNTLEEGSRMSQGGYRMLKAYGGLEDVLGPVDLELETDAYFKNITLNPVDAPDADGDGVPDYLDPESANKLPAGAAKKDTKEKGVSTDKAIPKYEDLSDSEKRKIEQLRKQSIKENPRLQGDAGIDSTKKFYNSLNRSDEMPEMKKLKNIIKFLTTPPKEKAFTGKPYNELSEENKKRIKQYKLSVGDKRLIRLSDSKFYNTLSEKELNKILK